MFRIPALSLAILIPVTALAQDFRSSNDLAVRAIDSTSFEVAGTQSSQDKSYWCAAANYVQTRLGNPDRARLTVVSPPGSLSSGTRNVGFSIAADAAKGKTASTSVSVHNVGANVSIGLASQFCQDLKRQENGL